MISKIIHSISQYVGQIFHVDSGRDPGVKKDVVANHELDDINSDEEFLRILERSRPFTLTSVERAYALYSACKYIVQNDIGGDFVECGVWKGGSAMIMALTLLSLNVTNRKLYLYDTFEGMSPPEDVDVNIHHQTAKYLLENNDKKSSLIWCYATEDDVRANLLSTGYKAENLLFLKGKVEHTIPNMMPEKVALLRLDTDWYNSTYHEMLHLYPRLTKSGVLIIDDYGHWVGAKKAVDDYFGGFNHKVLLHRIDYTGRMLVKQ